MGDDVYKRSREGIVKVNRDGSKTVAYKSEFGKEIRYERNQHRAETLVRDSGELRRGDPSPVKGEETEAAIPTLQLQNREISAVQQETGHAAAQIETGQQISENFSMQEQSMQGPSGVVQQGSSAMPGQAAASAAYRSSLSRKSAREQAVSRSTLSSTQTKADAGKHTNLESKSFGGVKGVGKASFGFAANGVSKVAKAGASGVAKQGTGQLQNSFSGDTDRDPDEEVKDYVVSGIKSAANNTKDAAVKTTKKAVGAATRPVRRKVYQQIEKSAAKAAQKAAAKTAQQTARAVERAAAKAAQAAAKAAAETAAKAAAATTRTSTTVVQVLVSNPVTLIICAVLIFLILMCVMGAVLGGTGLITQRLDPSYNMPWYELRQYVAELETETLQSAEQTLRDQVERINSGTEIPSNAVIPADGSSWYVSVYSLDGTTLLRQTQQLVRLLVGCCFSNLNFVEGGDNYEEKKAFIDKIYGSWGDNQESGILWSWKSYIYDTGVIDSNGLHQYKVMYCISINDLDTIKERIGVGLSEEDSLMTTEQWNTFADAYGAYQWWAEQDLDQFWNVEAGDPLFSDETTVSGSFILDTRTTYYGDDKIVAGSFGAAISEQDYLDSSHNAGQDALDYEQQVETDYSGAELHTHTGIDLVTNPGVHVVSATAGTVIAVGVENAYSSLADQDHGNYITILCQDNIVMTYSHLDSVASLEVGDTVEMGSYLGTVGRSGKISPTIEAAVDEYVERLYDAGQWYVDETLGSEEKWGYVHLEVSINGYYANANEYMNLEELEYSHN